jgi:hypothetical protein
MDIFAEIKAMMAKRQSVMFNMAESACARIWEENRRRMRSDEAKLKYMVHVEKGGLGVLIRWWAVSYTYNNKLKKYEQRSTNVNLGEDKARTKKDGKTRYKRRHSLRDFKAAADWELELIEDAERKLQVIREETEWLVDLSHMISKHPVMRAKSRREALARLAKPPAVDESFVLEEQGFVQ